MTLQATESRQQRAISCQAQTAEAGVAVAPDRADLQAKKGSRAVVIGGGLAGLATARCLSDLFDEIILLERDAVSQQVCSPAHRLTGFDGKGDPFFGLYMVTILICTGLESEARGCSSVYAATCHAGGRHAPLQ